MRRSLPFAVCILLCLAVSAMADSQPGAESNATDVQLGEVQVAATNVSGGVSLPQLARASAAAQKRRQEAIARRVANRKMAAGSTPVAAAAATGPVAEILGEDTFSIASVTDTDGPTRAGEQAVMPTPVATPEAGAAAADEDERDYSDLLVNLGSTVDPFAGMTIYKRDPTTGKLVADTYGQEAPTDATSSGSLATPTTAAAPAAAVPAAPSTAVPTEVVWTDPKGAVTAAPVLTTPATPAQQPIPATPAAPVTAPTPSTDSKPSVPTAPATPATPAAADPAAAAPVTTPDAHPAQEPAAEPVTSTPTAAKAAADPTEPTQAAVQAPAAAADTPAAATPAASAPQPSEPAEPSRSADADADADMIAVPASEAEHKAEPEDTAEAEDLELELPAPDNNAVTATSIDNSAFTNTPAGSADRKLPAGRAAAIARRNGATPSSDGEQPPAPTRCGKDASFTCEIEGLCTARDGCACSQRIGSKAADTSSTCNCNAARGFRLTTQNGEAACAWDLSFGDTTSYEVPRLGTVQLPLTLAGGACPSASQKVISDIDLEAAKPVTCPRDANFVRLAMKRSTSSNPWGSEVCEKGAGGHYLLRTTLRGTARGDCRMVKVMTTDARSHNLVFKYY